MALDPEEFTKVLLAALAVQDKLQDVICTELKKEIISLNSKLAGRDSKIHALKLRVCKLKDKFENKCDELEQYSRRNSLRISGITELENNDDPCQRSLDLFKEMNINPPISIEDTERIHRVGVKQDVKPRSILVKFSNYRARRRVFKAKSVLREKGRHPDTPWAVNSDERSEPQTQKSTDDEKTSRKVFTNEDLTKKRANLLWKARCMKRDKRISDCWTSDGHFLIKNLVNKIILIHNSSELDVF